MFNHYIHKNKYWIAMITCLLWAMVASWYHPQAMFAQTNPSMQIQLEQLRVVYQDDGFLGGGDEPYLIVLAFRSRYKTPNSTQTFWNQNIDSGWADGVEANNVRNVPAHQGLVTNGDSIIFDNIELVTVDDIADGRFPEFVGAVVIAMEDDKTSDGKVRESMNKARATLENELRTLIENGGLELSNLDRSTLEQAANRIKESAKKITPDIGSIIDADNLIGYHLFLYVPVDLELGGFVPTIEDSGIKVGDLKNQRFAIGTNPISFEGAGSKYEVTMSITSNATTRTREALTCEKSYETFSRQFMPMIQTAGGTSPNIPPSVYTTLNAIQYNVQFLTPWNDGKIDPAHWPNTTERATALGQALACYDIVALNETVNDTRRTEIMTAMNAAAPNCGKPNLVGGNSYFQVADGPDVNSGPITNVTTALDAILSNPGIPIIGNELMIVSRLPIVMTNSYTYQARSGIDSLTAKGVLYARLRGPSQDSVDYVDVFATHLQAGDEAVRSCQVAELADFIRAKADPNIPILLLGDFNIDGDSTLQNNPSSQYTYLMNTFALLGTGHLLEDLGRSLTKGTNHSDDATEHRQHRIDYIFASPPMLTSDSTKRYITEYDGYPWGTLSDHAAVEADMAWLRKDVLPSMPDTNRLVTIRGTYTVNDNDILFSITENQSIFRTTSVNPSQSTSAMEFRLCVDNEVSAITTLSISLAGDNMVNLSFTTQLYDDDTIFGSTSCFEPNDVVATATHSFTVPINQQIDIVIPRLKDSGDWVEAHFEIINTKQP